MTKKRNFGQFYRFSLSAALTAVIAFAIILFLNTNVFAASASTDTLEVNQTYTQYDITGDGQADTIQLTGSYNSRWQAYTDLEIKINDQTALISDDSYYSLTAQLITLENGKCFLYLYNPLENGDGSCCGIYQYKDDELKCLVNFNKFFGGSSKYGNHNSGEIVSVSGNKIKVKANIMSAEVASLTATYTYAYKSGTLKRTDNTTKTFTIGWQGSKTLTTATSVNVYTSTKCSKVSYKLKSGKKIKVLAVYNNSGKFLLKVKNLSTGKTGYIKCRKKFPMKAPYKEVHYAG